MLEQTGARAQKRKFVRLDSTPESCRRFSLNNRAVSGAAVIDLDGWNVAGNGHLRLLLREIMEVRSGCLPSYLVQRSHFMVRKMTASDTGRSELEEHSLEELFGSD